MQRYKSIQISAERLLSFPLLVPSRSPPGGALPRTTPQTRPDPKNDRGPRRRNSLRLDMRPKPAMPFCESEHHATFPNSFVSGRGENRYKIPNYKLNREIERYFKEKKELCNSVMRNGRAALGKILIA